MASDVRIGVRTDTGASDKSITTLRQKLFGLNQDAKSSILGGVGLGAGVAGFNLLGTAVEGATRFVVDSIDAASHLNETISKTGQIFGQEMLPGLEQWAEGAADAFGQSEQQALDAASTFAIFGKSAGKSGEDLVGFSTELTELASDLASFHDATPEEAILAIGSALRGESEPIRRFGVLLDDATLKARAMKLGIIDTTTNALTPQQKVLAAQAEILAQTSDAQGDFERTQSGLANTSRQLQAKMGDLSAEIGEKLLPVAVGLAEALLFTVDAVEQLIGSVGRLTDYWNPFETTTEEIADKFNSTWGQLPGIAEMQLDATGEAVGHGIGEVVSTVVEGSRQAADGGAREIGKTPKKMADALLENQFHLQPAIDELLEFMDNALKPAEEKARLRAFLASRALARGLASNNPLIRRKAEEMRDAATDRLDTLTQVGMDGGRNLSLGFAQGITAGSGDAFAAAARLASGVAGFLPVNSPPADPRSALRNIYHAGDNLVDAVTGGIRRRMGDAENTAGALAKALARGRGGRGGAGAGGDMGGITVQLPPTTVPYSPGQYRDAVREMIPELVRELRRQGYAF